MTIEDYIKHLAQELEEDRPQKNEAGAYVFPVDGYDFVFKKGPRGEPLLEYELAKIQPGPEGEEELKKLLRYNFAFLKREPQCVLSFDEERSAVYFWRNLEKEASDTVIERFEKLINNLDIMKKVIHN